MTVLGFVGLFAGTRTHDTGYIYYPVVRRPVLIDPNPDQAPTQTASQRSARPAGMYQNKT